MCVPFVKIHQTVCLLLCSFLDVCNTSIKAYLKSYFSKLFELDMHHAGFECLLIQSTVSSPQSHSSPRR